MAKRGRRIDRYYLLLIGLLGIPFLVLGYCWGIVWHSWLCGMGWAEIHLDDGFIEYQARSCKGSVCYDDTA